LQVDLGATYSISQVVLSWEAAYAKAYQIQVSNDSNNWTAIYNTTNGAGGIETLNVNGSGRYVRIYGTARATAYGYSLWEFAVYGSGVTPPPPIQWSSIKAMANGNFVSADNAGASPLIANRTTAQGWEKFQIVNNGDGTISFLSMANGKYVSADISTTGGNKLIAQATTIQQWEKFKQVDLGNGTVAFQALANNQFVSCDLNTGAPTLIADRAAVGGAWEAFVVSPA